MRSSILTLSAAGALALAACSLAHAAPAVPAGHPTCTALTARDAALRREKGALDARLQELVTRMNGATGERKVQALSDVLSELVAQRRALQQIDDEARHLAMQHVALHAAEGPAAVARCPYLAGRATPGPAEPSGTGAARGAADDTPTPRAAPGAAGPKPSSSANQPEDDSGAKGTRPRGERDPQKPR